MPRLEFNVDDRLLIIDCNEELAKKHPGRTLAGVPYFDILPRIIHENCDAVAMAMKSGNSLSLDNHRFGCPFEVYEADVRISPLYDEKQKISGARVIIDGGAGCSLANQLEQSQHLIDIGKMASILSHGVRNPLNAIKGAVVYLKSRYGSEANLLEFTQIMEDEISRLDKFITDFLSTSFYGFEQSQVDINVLLKKIELFIGLQAQAAGLKVEFSYGEVLPLQLNAFQIEHAILNLLNNAMQALPRGGEISVRTMGEVTAGRRAMIVEVADNGPGIPEPALKNLKAPLNANAISQGRGFGLFITREIIQHHGGSLEIKTWAGRGTVVRIFLPAGEEGER